MKRIIAIVALLTLVAVAIMPQPAQTQIVQAYSSKVVNDFKVMDDSLGTAADSGIVVKGSVDHDTTISYDAWLWDQLTIAATVTANAGSTGVTIYPIVSFDKTNWAKIDSLLIASTAASGSVHFDAWTFTGPYKYLAFELAGIASTDSSSGCVVNIRAMYEGAK